MKYAIINIIAKYGHNNVEKKYDDNKGILSLISVVVVKKIVFYFSILFSFFEKQKTDHCSSRISCSEQPLRPLKKKGTGKLAKVSFSKKAKQ